MSRVPDPLNLQGISPRYQFEQEHQITYLAALSPPRVPENPCCPWPLLKPHDRRRYVYRDQPLRRKFVDIWLKRERYRCRRCGAEVLAIAPGMDDDHRMTKRMAEDVFQSCLRRTNSEVAAEFGISEGTVRNIFGLRVDAALAAIKWETPRVLGIDEKHIAKKYCCVIGNVEERTMLDMLPSRNKDVLDAYFTKMPDKHRVEIVCMDMYKNYRDMARKHFPRAQIIADKYHVVRMANDAMEKGRREIRRLLPKDERLQMRNERFTVLRRVRDWGPEDLRRYERWQEEYPSLIEAFEFKEGFFRIFEVSSSFNEAARSYLDWDRDLPHHLRPFFSAITTAMRTWGNSALMAMEPGYEYTSAYIEALNGFIGELHHAGRRLDFHTLRAKALLAYGADRRWRREAEFKRLEPEEVVEVDGQEVELGTIRYSRDYEPRLLPRTWRFGIPFSTLREWVAEGRI